MELRSAVTEERTSTPLEADALSVPFPPRERAAPQHQWTTRILEEISVVSVNQLRRKRVRSRTGSCSFSVWGQLRSVSERSCARRIVEEDLAIEDQRLYHV